LSQTLSPLATFVFSASSARSDGDGLIRVRAADARRRLSGGRCGWITDYDAMGRTIGLANVETTCMAILGLEASNAHKTAKDPH